MRPGSGRQAGGPWEGSPAGPGLDAAAGPGSLAAGGRGGRCSARFKLGGRGRPGGAGTGHCEPAAVRGRWVPVPRAAVAAPESREGLLGSEGLPLREKNF